MLINKKHIIFLAVMLVAMMSVAVAADVNDSNTESTTPAITHTTDNTNVQTATQPSNEITKKTDNNIVRKTNNEENTMGTIHNINNTNFDDYVTSTGLTPLVNGSDTLNFTSDVIRTNSSYVINDTININGNGFTLDLNTINGYSDASNPTYIEFNSYANNSIITNLKFHNTQVFTTSASNIVFDNINVTIDNQGVGKGTGYFAMRTGVSNITVKNSYFYAANNTGCSAVVITFGENCTIDNNTIIGQGTVGNLVYLNLFGQTGNGITQNKNNTIINNIIIGPDESSSICHAITIGGPHNHIINNTINYNGTGILGNWAGTYDPATNTTNDYYNDTYLGNGYINNTLNNGASFSGAQCSLVAGNTFTGTASIAKNSTVKNNIFYKTATINQNSNITDNQFNSTVTIKKYSNVIDNTFNSTVTINEYSNITNNIFKSDVTLNNNVNFKNNNAENSTVTVTGPNCDLCNNTINTLVVLASPTYVCYDNTFTNDPDYEDPHIIWYDHGTRGNSLTSSNNVLNKKVSSSVKTEGEEGSTEINITNDETFLAWFKVNANTGLATPISTNIIGDTVYNLYYIPENVTGLNFRITGKDASRCRDFHYSIIGKSLGENNIVLKKLTIGQIYVYVANITIVNENDDTATSSSSILTLNGLMGAPGNNVTLDNIKLNATIEPNTYVYISYIASYFDVTIQNSEFNVKAPGITNTFDVIRIRSEGVKLINNTFNVEETMSIGDNPSIAAIHTTQIITNDNPYNLTCKYNRITLIGEADSESTLYGLKLDGNTSTITNNNITVTTTGKATGVELNGNDNIVTDNYILTNDKTGDSAVTDNGENNIVENNAPLITSLKIIAPATANINEATPITILLKDNTGKLIPEQEVKVTVGDNQTETVTTDEDGIAVYNLTATTSGELNLTITYEAQGAYTESNTTVTINVNEDKDAIIEELNNTIKENEETITALNETVNNQTEAINELNNTVNEQAQTITEQKEAINELNNTVNEQAQTIDEQAQAISDLNETANQQAQTITEQKEAINNLNDTVNEQAQTITEQKEAINNLNDTVNEQAQTITEQEEAINDLNDTVNNQTAAIEDLENSVEELKDIINNLTSTKASTITLDAVEDAQVGDTITITGTLSDENGYGIPGTVKLLINNGRATVKTNVNGEFTYGYTVTKVGTYNVTASFMGTDSYTASNTTMNFDVAQQDTIIVIDEITPVKSGSNVTVTGTLLDANSNPIKGTIKLLINNGRATVKTDDEGVFTYNFVASKVGINNITASYLESTKYLASNATATVEVTAMDTQIVFDEISSAKKGEKITISGKLVDENGNAVTGTIKLLINNGRATVKTDENGVFTYEYTVTKVGENNITASYLGANRYTATEATTTAQVEKLATTITLNNIGTVTQKSMVEISGKLSDENGKAITGTIKLLINNGRKTIKTDNTGAFTYSHNATFAGENTITANYLESNNYLPTNTTTTFTVTKA